MLAVPFSKGWLFSIHWWAFVSMLLDRFGTRMKRPQRRLIHFPVFAEIRPLKEISRLLKDNSFVVRMK